jgi:hypothetical protein
MKLIDKALGLIGLERKSQNPFAYVSFSRYADQDKPDTVDIRLKNGQRFSGEMSGPKLLMHVETPIGGR